MQTDTEELLNTGSALLGKVALELVYAQPEKDGGLLPINNLVSQLEELVALPAFPPVMREAIGFGRKCVDDVFGNPKGFTAADIQKLGSWIQWVQLSWDGLKAGQVLPALPQEWGVAAPAATASTPAVATTPATVEGAQINEDLALTLNMAEDADLLREFVNESHEHLQNIELGVLVLEENPQDADTLASIFRAFHTFKGGSGLLNLKAINVLAHELESLLDLARQHKLEVNSTVINVILDGGDLLKQFILQIGIQLNRESGHVPILIPISTLLGRVRAILQGPGSSAEAAPSPAVGAPKAAAATATVATVALPEPVKKAPAAVSAPVLVMPAVVESAPAVESKPPASRDGEHKPTGQGVGSTVKVDTNKLDALVDLVGEMVIAQSMVAQDPDLGSLASQRLSRNLGQLGRITNELQRTAMSLRMVPIKPTFQKMTRLVRDLAAQLGKKVDLELEGEETELDRTIVEEISDPLVHMVRNSVDHGVEMPDVRLQRGKPAGGTINLRAYHQGGNIVIEVRDNGGGLNAERIRAKAIEKGMISASDQLADKELFALIFAPGFSTAEKVTGVSGRGVGMDVVRRNIEKLRGKIEIDSTLGVGSCITIRLPLTLAIIDGLIVSVGEHRYILPTLSVRESFRPSADMLSTLHGRGEMINVRGRLSPMLRLHEFFGVEPKSNDPCQSIAVVVESDNENRCLIVDNLLGKQEVVIKSLGEIFKSNPYVAGGAILGDGRVGLIVDVNALVKLRQTATAKAA